MMLERLKKFDKLEQLQAWQHEFLPLGFQEVFTQAALPEPLNLACRYAMSNGGKRVRPLLVMAAAISLGRVRQQNFNFAASFRAALAVELIHGYSLVHDDLPCLDDDVLRRGQPTCHVVYGEAVALLAGDALQSLAFETLTTDRLPWQIDPLLSSKLQTILAPRSRRMVSGQMLDIEGEKKQLTQCELESVHTDKTGALIEASVLMGGICANADADDLDCLQRYAQAVGLAFQVQDDVLDVISDTQTLGKPAGSDVKLGKSTYVTLLGVQDAKDYANNLFNQAYESVQVFGKDNLLMQLVQWLKHRNF